MTLTATLVRPDEVEIYSAEKTAEALLIRMREMPMRRGALSKRARMLRGAICGAIASQDVPPALARRLAFQLAFKFHPRELHDRDVWDAIGRSVRSEMTWLRERVGMPDRKIICVLPKLSAAHIQEFLDELTAADRRIARTILNAAIDASDPIATGRRYLAEYRLVAHRLRAIDPTMARTLANATFSAVMPLDKALEHMRLLRASSI